jgi:prepilin-type processing-associated H-X9-DG protein
MITVHLAIMSIALAAAFGVFRRSERPTRQSLWRIGGIIVGIDAIVFGMILAFEEVRIYTRLHLVLVWLVVGPACLISLVAQLRGRRPTITFVLGWLAAIGVLVFLGLPLIGINSEAGWRSQCRFNLGQVARMLPNLSDAPDESPPRLAEGDRPMTWRIRGYLAAGDRATSWVPPFDLDKPWNDPANLTLGRERVSSFACPANFNPTDELGRFFTAYAAVTGPKTAFPGGAALPLDQFTDGTSNTIAFGECAGLKIVWTEPRDIDISRQPVGINLPGKQRGESPGTLSSYHPPHFLTGATVVFADGHVQFLNGKMDPAVLAALLTATGGEPVRDGSY